MEIPPSAVPIRPASPPAPPSQRSVAAAWAQGRRPGARTEPVPPTGPGRNVPPRTGEPARAGGRGRRAWGTVFLAVCCLCLVRPIASAYDWTAYGVTELSKEEQEDGTQALRLKDEIGNEFELRIEGEVAEGVARRIIQLKDTLFGWREIKFKSMRVNVVPRWRTVQVEGVAVKIEDAVIEILVVPDKLAFESVDLSAHLPAGLYFVYDDGLSYDVRLAIRNTLVPIAGRFKDEASLLERLTNATREVEHQLASRDPDRVFRRLDALDAALAGINDRCAEIEGRIQVADESRGDSVAKVSSRQLGLVGRLEAYSQETAEHLQRLDALLGDFWSSHEALRRDHADLRYACLAAHNRGRLNGVRPVDRGTVGKVLALRKARPEWGAREIRAELRAEGIKITQKEVDLILTFFQENTKDE